MKKEILIIEDDLSLQKTISDYLKNIGFVCYSSETLTEGKALFEKKFFPIVLLDLNLPDGEGLDYISHIKSIWNKTCVIIISARDKLDDRIDGLNLGADDYLVKPFHLSELNARINALLRRNFQPENKILKYNEIEIDPYSQTVKLNEIDVEFSRKEFDLILFFFENQNKVLTKENLFEHVWGENSAFMDNADFIYTHINRLRKKIKLHTGQNYIKTVHGFGYKFETQA
jgi:DNA-binding response OmpR family regulator